MVLDISIIYPIYLYNTDIAGIDIAHTSCL